MSTRRVRGQAPSSSRWRSQQPVPGRRGERRTPVPGPRGEPAGRTATAARPHAEQNRRMALHPQARASIEAAAGTVQAFEPGFDIAADRERARAEAAAADREDVAEVRDLDADGVPVRLYRPEGAARRRRAPARRRVRVPRRRRPRRRLPPAREPDRPRRPQRRLPAAARAPLPRRAGRRRHGRRAGSTAGAGLGLGGPSYVHGDSAGGNLALVAALRHPGRFDAAVLIYPFLDPTAGFDSYRLAGVGFDPREAAWYWQQYAATPADLEDPDLAPLRSDRLGTLPPTLVVTAEHDPLRDEGEELARRLAEAGVAVTGDPLPRPDPRVLAPPTRCSRRRRGRCCARRRRLLGRTAY